MKLKTFFFVSQVLCFRHTKQTRKNVADITFKLLKMSAINKDLNINKKIKVRK